MRPPALFEAAGLLHPCRAENGRRIYRTIDVRTLTHILLLKRASYTLREIASLSARAAQRKTTSGRPSSLSLKHVALTLMALSVRVLVARETLQLPLQKATDPELWRKANRKYLERTNWETPERKRPFSPGGQDFIIAAARHQAEAP